MSKKRSAGFNAKITLAALANGKSTSRRVSWFEIHPNIKFTWKRQFLESPADFFDKNCKSRKQIEGQINEF